MHTSNTEQSKPTQEPTGYFITNSKEELEARVDENRIFMARLGRYTETSGVKVEVFDHIDQLTNGEGDKNE